MLKRLPLALLTLCISTSALSQQPRPDDRPVGPAQAAPTQQQAQPDKRGTREQPLIIETVPARQSEADHTRETEEKAAKAQEAAAKERLDTELVRFTGELANYTLGLFIATVFLVLATVGTLVVATLQIRQSRKEFNATHRPEIIVHGFDVTREFLGPDREAICAQFTIVNKGTRPAEIVEIVGSILPSKDLRPGAHLAPIAYKKLRLADGEVLNDIAITSAPYDTANADMATGFDDGVRRLWCIGRIIYEDGQGRRRETGFCRVFHGKRQRWVKEPGSEYEYAY